MKDYSFTKQELQELILIARDIGQEDHVVGQGYDPQARYRDSLIYDLNDFIKKTTGVSGDVIEYGK